MIERLHRKFIFGLVVIGLMGCGEPRHTGPLSEDRPPEAKPQIPVEATFASIRENILEPKCWSCHASGKSVQRIPLVTYQDLMLSPLDLVLPGNPEESGLYISVALERPENLMPPLKFNDGTLNPDAPLAENEVQAIFDWIANGARE